MEEADTGATVSEAATTLYQRVIPANSPSSFAQSMNIAFYASTFGPGAEFALVMLAKKITNEGTVLTTDTIASISITINDAPIPGKFSVSPDHGKEMSTLFTMTCVNWSDDDLPLTFAFGYWSISNRNVPVSA